MYMHTPEPCTVNVSIHSFIKTLSRFQPSQLKRLPEMVHDYNAHMMGVDRMDQMMSYYSFERKSIKWWRKYFSGCWKY